MDLLHLPGQLPAGAAIIGGFVGVSGWLPFWSRLESEMDMLDMDISAEVDERMQRSNQLVRAMQLFHELAGLSLELQMSTDASSAHRSTEMPMFLAHGTNDAVVDVELGRDAQEVLRRLFSTITWREYAHAEQVTGSRSRKSCRISLTSCRRWSPGPSPVVGRMRESRVFSASKCSGRLKRRE